MNIILLDGIRYLPQEYEKEEEIEEMIEEHSESIFGKESIYFGKKKLTSLSGIASIPDAYVVMFSEKPRWFVIEVELANHDVYQHVVPQLNKFINGIKSDKAKRDLIYFMDNELRKDVSITKKITDKYGEIYKFLSDVVYGEPTYLIIIDRKIPLLSEAIDNLQAQTEVIEFKTFQRENVGKTVHAHLFEPMFSIKETTLNTQKYIKNSKPYQSNASRMANYANAQIIAFKFNGQRYEVQTWRELLIKLTEIIADLHKDQFDNVLKIAGRKRPYFAKSSNALRVPKKIKNTNIYVEVHLSANAIVRLANKLMVLFEHAKDDLTFELK
jgi:hypothetical protein